MYVRFLEAELVSRLKPYVADDDNALLVHHDRLTPAEFLDGLGYRVDGHLRDPSRVLGIRFDF